MPGFCHFLAVVLTIAALCQNSCAQRGSAPAPMDVTINNETFTLEVAADDESRDRGLMRRDKIEEHGGMIFTFPRSAMRSFWMGHCLVDIDIVFLDSVGRVTAKHTMLKQPPQAPGESDEAYKQRMPTYSSGKPAQFAVELAAGSFDRLGVKVGDKLPLDLKKLKDMAR